MLLLKYLPIWKVIVYLFISMLLSMVTGFILITAASYLEEGSRFFESFFFLLSYFQQFLLILFYLVIVCFYLFIFYQFERNRFLSYYIEKMGKNVQLLTNTDISTRMASIPSEFQALADSLQDILMQSEEAIEEVKKAEQLKNDLITNVAHDLRSPLTSILGYLELINQDRYRDEVELRHYIQVVYDKSSSLHTLINDIFEYTYMQNQPSKLTFHAVNMEELLNQLAIHSKTQLERNGMEYRFYSSVKHSIVMADGGKLIRVLENLIQNAIRYGNEGKYIDIALRDTEEIIEIEIANYGHPIPPSDLPYIFDRFYRVEKSRSHYTGGSGLGLAIAKSIIDQHNGTIEVVSNPTRTAFTIKLVKEQLAVSS